MAISRQRYSVEANVSQDYWIEMGVERCRSQESDRSRNNASSPAINMLALNAFGKFHEMVEF